MRFLLALCLLVASGCSSSSVQQTTDEGQAALRTRPIPIYEDASASMTLRSAEAPYQITAITRCPDANCAQGGAFLVVRSMRGVHSGTINYIPVTMNVDGVQYTWPELDNTVQQQRVASGEILRLAMDITKLRAVAFGDDVDLNLGSTRFPLTYNQREPLRQLIAELQGGPVAGTS
jgi:hypothetical protein